MKTESHLKTNRTSDQEIRLYREFALWSKERKREYLRKLPAYEVWRYKYIWAAWARDAQLAPEGDWSTWVIQAGRGFGKTRAGAEWTADKAQTYPGCHIALVGRTVADVRDVMVKGRSGILAISPPWFKPEYKPSLRQLIWPNGSYATTYSADEPDQLRGPQHSFAWCLAGDTPILMGDGQEKQIGDIRVGDFVMTRKGPRQVIGHCLTKRNAEVYLLRTVGRQSIIGTAEHPVWVQGKGFVPMALLSEGMPLCVTRASNGMATLGTLTHLPDIMALLSGLGCIECFGNKPMALFLKDIIFTIKTAIKQITDLKILKFLRMENIVDYMLRKNWVPIVKYRWLMRWLQRSEIVRSAWRGFLSVHCAVRSIIAHHLTLLDFVHRNVLMLLAQVHLPVKCGCAFFARQNIAQKNVRKDIVPDNAIIGHLNNAPLHWRLNQFNALNAIQHFNPSDQMPASAPENVPLLSTTVIDSVEKLATRYDVYDLTVEDAHEFFAHGILVHNCDERAAWQYDDSFDQMSFGLRIEPSPGIHPQCIVTTTPRNTKSMKSLVNDPTTVVTRGSTYENRDNLSPRFIREIDRHYSGTRLGLQEIEGEIVDDIDGALWKRKWIDDSRVVKYPDLKRIVVAVDPPASSPETSDSPAECGIVVVGLGIDDHGYVLADYSIVGTPDEWASEVLAAYTTFKGDLIVGEVNNGGDMVGHTIKTAAKMAGMRNIPYEAIRASRGKQVRAEPVSTLYKNQHVHHVGVHADLEFQLCNWVPGEKSPDRLDAVVWGVTKLMIPEGQGGGVLIDTTEDKDTIPPSTWEELVSQADYY